MRSNFPHSNRPHTNGNTKKIILPSLTWGFYVFEILESQVGGIADVAEGLPRALVLLQTKGDKTHRIFRVTPYYKDMPSMIYAIPLNELQKIATIVIPYQNSRIEVIVYKRIYENEIIDYLLFNDIFDRAYSKSDNNKPDDALKEVVAYNAAAAALILLGETQVNIPFLADWQTGLMLSYLLEAGRDTNALLNQIEVTTKNGNLTGSHLVSSFISSGTLKKIVPICWVNNEAYRGQFAVRDFDDFRWKTGLISRFSFEASRWITPERLSEIYTILLKLSVETVRYGYGGEVITVSKTYANEVMGYDLKPGDYPGMLCGIFRRIGVKGILNGVSYLWRYVTDLSQKAEAKIELQKQFGFSIDKDKKLAFMVSRLVSQKGVSILLDAEEGIIKLLQDFPELQLMIGGRPENYWRTPLEKFKQQLETEFPDRVRIELDFLPEELVRKIFIAGDIQLFPSLYEPCGTLPKAAYNMVITVGRRTGGIAEGAVEIKKNFGNAVLFNDYSSEAFMAAWRKAMRIAQNKARWASIQKNSPATVRTWKMQADEYAKIIHSALINKGFKIE